MSSKWTKKVDCNPSDETVGAKIGARETKEDDEDEGCVN